MAASTRRACTAASTATVLLFLRLRLLLLLLLGLLSVQLVDVDHVRQRQAVRHPLHQRREVGAAGSL
jgi:hypothetical protein